MADKLIHGSDPITTLGQSPESRVERTPIAHNEIFRKVTNPHVSDEPYIMGVTYTTYDDGSKHESKVKLYWDYENFIEEDQ